MPVVIGVGSHPFPFRTRKLSLLPPMVLCGQLHGRVGHCRDYSPRAASQDAALFFLLPLVTSQRPGGPMRVWQPVLAVFVLAATSGCTSAAPTVAAPADDHVA